MPYVDTINTLRFPMRPAFYLPALAALGLSGFIAGCIAVGAAVTHPAVAPIDDAPDLEGVEEIRFASGSGSDLAAWAAPGRAGCGSVVLLHGIRANRESLRGRMELFHEAGYSVLAVDLQGHGESGGEQITLGHLEREDAISAVAEARRRFPGERVGVVGISLGGAAAALAGERLRADAVVLEAVYADIESATDNRLAMYLGPAGPLLSPALLAELPRRVGVTPDALRPTDGIGRLGAPVLVVAGREDRHTRPADSWALYRAAEQPKALWWVEGAAHVDFLGHDPDGYRARVLPFLAHAIATDRAAGCVPSP